MANLDSVESVVGGLRQVIQDLVAPEIREVRPDLRALTARIEKLEHTVEKGFEGVSRQLDTYKDVQIFKERMARMEGERSLPVMEQAASSAKRPA